MLTSGTSSYWKQTNQQRKLLKKKLKEEKLLKTLQEKEKSDQELNIPAEVVSKTIKSPSTVSIAVPASILENAQTQELKAYLVGQIARATCMFQIDEIIVYDDYAGTRPKLKGILKPTRPSCILFGRILQYLECPQYLRKHFFPIHDDLKYVGLINPLDSQHHFRQKDEFPFRDGVVTNKPSKQADSCYVNVGLLRDVRVDKALMPGTRVTVKLEPYTRESKKYRGTVVPPSLPRAETGIYWGYNLRISNSFSEIFSESPYIDGYDLAIGTSERGTSIDDVSQLKYNHAVIVFGGLHGIEAACENDPNLTELEPRSFFHHYLNTLPNQGSGTIRTEEAVLVTLSVLRNKLCPLSPVKNYVLSK